jgi:hypothetical protein
VLQGPESVPDGLGNVENYRRGDAPCIATPSGSKLVRGERCADAAEDTDMADEQPSLHIDTDWKKQAQEEKRRLAEQEQKRAAAAPATTAAPSAAPPSPGGSAPGAPAAADSGRGGGPGLAPAAGRERQLPPASFTTLVQSLVTQILFYLGELGARGSEPMLNLDMAKHNIDVLGVLEEKTRGNLTDEEKRLLDGALYESRMRYVAVASQFATV